MKIIQLSLLLLVSTLIFSCEKEIPLDEEQIKPRIVVNSVFAANDTIRINLSESRNILYNNGGALPNIEDATAKLYDSNNTELGTFVYETEGDYYLPTPFPMAGNSYTLKVSHPNFDDITTTTTTPSIVNIVQIDTLRTGEKLNIDVTINDDPNDVNYYSLVLTSSTKEIWEIEPGVFDSTQYFYQNWICTKDINAEGTPSAESGEICSQELLFSDKSFNGSQHTIRVSDYYNESTDYILVSLRSMSQDLFKYRVTYLNYENNSENPFGEPVQVYSNVENGFGIFSGYSEYKDSIVFTP